MKKIFTVAIIFAIVLISACGKENFHYERTEEIFGTPITIKAEGRNSRVAVDESFEKIFELVENIKTDVKILNDSAGNGKFVKISPEVFEVLKISQKYSALTNGAFDVTIGAAVDLWKIARKNKILPSDEEISSVKNFVGYQHLILDEMNLSARLDKIGVKINLGGIGKGYGVDIAREIFEKHGIADGIINFGTSSIFAFGEKKIGLRNPRVEDEISEIVELKNSALSTSGDYEQFLILNGRRYHHIINPKTCMPTENNMASVSVVVDGSFENCNAIGDVLSTSIFILGAENGKNLLSKIDAEKIEIISVKFDEKF